jgi:hypothetical protein
LGKNAFTNDPEKLKNLAMNQFTLTKAPAKKALSLEIINGEKKTFTETTPPEVKEYTEESFNFDSYSVVGWFKWVEPAERKPCHLMFRLTNNEKEYFDDARLGDRTLTAF